MARVAILYRVRAHITDHATLQRLQALLTHAGASAHWVELLPADCGDLRPSILD